MGLIIDDRGHYRGWLASFLCCCAALTEDEHPKERDGYKASGGYLVDYYIPLY